MRLFFIATILFYANSAIGQVAVGLYAGFDKSKFSGDTPRNFEYELQNGFVAGLSFDFGVGNKMFVSIRPNYTSNGADVSIPLERIRSFPAIENKYDTTFLFPITNEYIAIPVIYQIYVARAFYANCGLDVTYNLTATADMLEGQFDIRDGFNVFLIGAVFGWGVSIPIGRTSFNLELSYTQSINTLTKVQDTEEMPAPRLRTRRFRLATYFTIFATKKTL